MARDVGVSLATRPWVLGANQPRDRFYAGGERIAAFRGEAEAAPHTPEDWVGSVTALFGEHAAGRTALEVDGAAVVLADAVAADPVGWLGEEHVARFGDDAGVLVKLLDAGQRLPVHAHPDVPFARRHLGLGHGKTEAWIFLEGAPVWLGFARDVSRDELAAWVREQDVDAMLGAMHRLDCAAGDAVLVPAGTPHAIGEGAFIVELQEPTDLSVLMEWRDFAIDGERDGHVGLGFGLALEAVERRGQSGAEVDQWRQARADAVGELLPDAEAFFRAERWRGGADIDPGYAVLVVTAGRGRLEWSDGVLDVARGSTILVPHGAGTVRLIDDGDLEVLRCRPPAV